jgi:aspartate/methionine/tyrosine aminotransferase
MSLSDFQYMVWAKTHRPARYDLSQSGLEVPGPELLDLARAAAGGSAGLRTALERSGPDMPDAIRRRVAGRFGLPAERLMLTLGTSHGLFLACRALLEPGDLALCERPAYEVLATLPAMVGARVERVERQAGSGWRLPATLCADIGRLRPRLLVLSNPHNPTGAVLGAEELAPVAEALERVGGVLLVDEVYLEFSARAAEQSLGRLGRNVVVVSSLTKAFGLGNVRFGWLAAEAELVARALRLNDYVTVLYPSPCAWVGGHALDSLEALQRRAEAVRRRNLPIVQAWIDSRSDVGWHPSEAAVIGLLQLRRLADTARWCAELHDRWDTLVVPGEFFEAPGHVRLGFGCAPEPLREGLARIGRALDGS